MKEYSASVVESLEYLTASLHTLMQGAQCTSFIIQQMKLNELLFRIKDII